jgi:hypothetical protein
VSYLAGSRNVLNIKCPFLAYHVGVLLNRKVNVLSRPGDGYSDIESVAKVTWH